MLVVVDDSDAKIRRANEGIVADFSAEGTRAVYLHNRRKRGASGAWNTALFEVQQIAPSAFIAILDDDDRWTPNYLQRCEEEVLGRGLDMVAAGIVYHETVDHEGVPLPPPDRLEVRDLLVRSTHIQGSNLFVRLSKLIEIEGFDEELVSTTDRDICIRLADLDSIRIRPPAGVPCTPLCRGRPAPPVDSRQRYEVPGFEALLSQVPQPHVRRAAERLHREEQEPLRLRPHDGSRKRDHLIDLYASVYDDRLVVSLLYSENYHRAGTARKLLNAYLSHLSETAT